MRKTPASLGRLETDIEDVDAALKGQAEDTRLYSRSCPTCKGEISFIGKNVPRDCPHCGQMFWFKPRDERRLFILQQKFLDSNRDPAILGEIFLEMRRYAGNLLKNRAKKGRNFSKAFLEEKSSDTANIFIERYITDPTFKIHVSFGMMLSKNLGKIYDHRDVMMDQAVSFDAPFFKNGATVADNMARLGLGSVDKITARSSRPIDENSQASTAVIRMINLIHDTIREQQGAKAAILFLCGIRLQLFARRPAHASDRFYSTFGSDARKNIEQAELLMRELVMRGALA